MACSPERKKTQNQTVVLSCPFVDWKMKTGRRFLFHEPYHFRPADCARGFDTGKAFSSSLPDTKGANPFHRSQKPNKFREISTFAKISQIDGQPTTDLQYIITQKRGF